MAGASSAPRAATCWSSFPSVSDAVPCALDVQTIIAERNQGVAPEQRMEFRVGINLGDVMIEGDDIFGTGVNVAARLQALADPGGICISQSVRDQVRGSLDLGFVSDTAPYKSPKDLEKFVGWLRKVGLPE